MALRDLTDDTALVTGASSGIGRATAIALAREGADVAVAARRRDRLEALADGIADDHGREALVVPTDVTDPAAVDQLVERTVDRFGGLDACVANAGLLAGSGVADLSNEDYRRMTDVNVDGTFFTARAALEPLVAAEGHLVFVGSFAGQYPRPFNPVYAATKWWTRGFAKSVSAAYGPEVAVSVVNPSEVRTEIGPGDDQYKELFGPGEVTEPEEIAEAIAFCVRQPASMVAEVDLYRRDKFVGF